MILEDEESNGGGERGCQKSFFCTQEHPKTVGNYNNPKGNTICTEVEMKDVDKKGYMKYYNLTHQTYSVKSKNCIFIAGDFLSVKIGAVFHENIVGTAICVQYVNNNWDKKM